MTLGHAVSIRFVWALEFLSQDDVYGGSAPLAGRGTDGGAVLLGTAVSAIAIGYVTHTQPIYVYSCRR